MKATIELTEEFFNASVIVEELTDTSRAIIPAPRAAEQVIRDEIRYHVSTMTAQLRIELRAGIEKNEAELSAMKIERDAMAVQRRILGRECAEVRNAREMLDRELSEARQVRKQTYELYNRVCSATGLCTPSRQSITGRRDER